MRVLPITLAACFAGLALASGAAAQPFNATVATFSDPSPGPGTPLFNFNASNGFLNGGWSGNGLLLETPGLTAVGDYPNAHFSMTQLTTVMQFGPVNQMSPGAISFFDQNNALLFTMTFQAAYLTNALGLGASDFLTQNVVFSGPMLAGYVNVNSEAFSFSFANPVQTGGEGPFGANSYTVTSAFTSSATVTAVPAPASALMLGLGGLVTARRRRR